LAVNNLCNEVIKVEKDTGKISLFIPQGLKAEREYFQGFGRRELLQAFYGSFVVLFIIVIGYILNHSILYVVMALLLGETTVVSVVSRSQVTNMSVVSNIWYAMRYLKEQQEYRYRQMDEGDRIGGDVK